MDCSRAARRKKRDGKGPRREASRATGDKARVTLEGNPGFIKILFFRLVSRLPRLPPLLRRRNELVELAGGDLLGVANLHTGAMILHHLVRVPDGGANLVAPGALGGFRNGESCCFGFCLFFAA